MWGEKTGKYALAICIALWVASCGASAETTIKDRGGNRERHDFGSWEKLEKKLLEQFREVQENKEEIKTLQAEVDEANEEYLNTEKGGYFGFFDPKEKARDRLDDKRKDLQRAKERLEDSEEVFKDYLASTPPDERQQSINGFRANREVAELRNALLNVQGTVETLGSMLKQDKTDSVNAVEYYQFYLQMLGYLQMMHASFIEKADGPYKDYLQKLWREWIKHNADLEREVEQIRSSQTRQLLQRKVDEGEEVVKQMPAVVRGLARMKEWASENLTEIREKKKAVGFLYDHAVLARDTEDLVRGIDTSFLALKFEEPPVVEYSIDVEKLKLENVPEGR